MTTDGTPVDLGTRMRGIVLVAAAIILVAFSWSHRPVDLRNFGEATQAQMTGEMVLKTPFFYGSFVVVAALVFMGVRTLFRRRID